MGGNAKGAVGAFWKDDDQFLAVRGIEDFPLFWRKEEEKREACAFLLFSKRRKPEVGEQESIVRVGWFKFGGSPDKAGLKTSWDHKSI